jgi:rhamnulokinase
LIAQADSVAPPDQVFNVDEGDLMLPGNVPARINEQRRQAGLDPLSEAPENAPAFTSLILHSLAARYAEVFRDLTEVTGKRLRQLYIVGGGSRNALLNRLTQAATGLEVRCGYVESATIGNLAIQLAVGDGAAHAQRSPDAQEIQRWASALGPAIDQESFV